jgi:hypothetical protein
LALFVALGLLFFVEAAGWIQQAALLDAPLVLPLFALTLSHSKVLCLLLLLLQSAPRATVLFLAGSVLSPLQTLAGRQPSPAMQSRVALLLPLVLALGPLWLVLFLLVHDKGELRSHQLFCGFG